MDHPEPIQEWKLNLETAAQPSKLDKKLRLPSKKNKFIVTIANHVGQKVSPKTRNGFLFRVLYCMREIILSVQ